MSTLAPLRKILSRQDEPTREPETIIEGRVLTLDELWVQASRLGKVSVEYMTFREKQQASIQMNIRGSFIIARGVHDDVRFALLEAIREAQKFSNT